MTTHLSEVQTGIDEQEQVLLEEHGVNHAVLDLAIP